MQWTALILLWSEKSLLHVSDQTCGLQEHRLQTAEQAEAYYKKHEKRPAPAGWEAFNNKTLFEAYGRRVEGMEVDLEVYSADGPLLPNPALPCQLNHIGLVQKLLMAAFAHVEQTHAQLRVLTQAT